MNHYKMQTLPNVLFVTGLMILCSGMAPLVAQETKNGTNTSDSTTIQALLVEVRQLRSALERSILIAPQLQVAVQKMQFQNARVDRLSQQLEDLRQRISSSAAEDAQFVSEMKEAEARVSQETDPLRRRELEIRIKVAKTQIEQQAVREQQQRAREGELYSQLQAEQGKLTEITDQLTALQKSLQTVPIGK